MGTRYTCARALRRFITPRFHNAGFVFNRSTRAPTCDITTDVRDVRLHGLPMNSGRATSHTFQNRHLDRKGGSHA